MEEYIKYFLYKYYESVNKEEINKTGEGYKWCERSYQTDKEIKIMNGKSQESIIV